MAKDINLLQGDKQPEPRSETTRLGGMDISPASIANRHLVSNLYGILVSDTRPTAGNEFPVHFDTASGVLSIWDGSEWKEVNLT